MPGVQNPHCRPWHSRNAACIGCSSPSLRRPSIVVIVGALRLQREHRARLHRAAVQVHGAGAALRGVAADVRAGQLQLLADQLDQQRARVDRVSTALPFTVKRIAMSMRCLLWMGNRLCACMTERAALRVGLAHCSSAAQNCKAWVFPDARVAALDWLMPFDAASARGTSDNRTSPHVHVANSGAQRASRTGSTALQVTRRSRGFRSIVAAGVNVCTRR